MLASPANPTGRLLENPDIAALLGVLAGNPDSWVLCDEIYQGLQYDGVVETALALDSDRLIVINSFSKFFGMTGWRVGWMVVPEALVEPLERLAQNLFIAPPTPSQYAALAAFEPATLELLEERRQAFQARRDFLYPAVRDLGFEIGAPPDGAFYLYADASRHTDDSSAFCARLLESEGVALTPGADFGRHRAAEHLRFAYTTSIERLETGVERLRRFVRAGA
jgi:aspartate/methionine/tyrosine aminotransferase